METRAIQAVGRRTASKRARRVGRAGDSRRDLAEQAREEVEAAILLVGGGHFPRVLISNLADGARCLDALRGLADATGVALDALPRADGHGIDVAVSAR